MATMDHLVNLGGECSAWCDIGGHTFHEQITYLINLLGDDDQTSVIFINCFGGMQDTQKISGVVQKCF